MDRQILYPAQIPLVEDGLNAQRNAMVGLGHLAGAAFGTNTVAASGFACSPAEGLAVTIAPGALLAPGVVDASAYGTLAAVSSALVRQFISRDPVSLTVPSAGATYVVYVTPQTVDADNTVLPFYNAADPSVTYAGQNNSGLAAPTVRRDEAVLAIGSSVPSGASPLWQIVVPAGATTLTADMLSIASGAPFYPSLAAVASRIIAPFNAQLAVAIGGYPLNAVVADPATPGTFWVSTADTNVSTPGASGATWQSLFNGYATEAWANRLFATIAQLQAEASTRSSADTSLSSAITAESSRAQTSEAGKANLSGGNNLYGGQTINQGNLTLSGNTNIPNNSQQVVIQRGDAWQYAFDYMHDNTNGNYSRQIFYDGNTSNVKDILYYFLDKGRLSSSVHGDYALVSDFGVSLASNGYQKLPGGLIIQWGVISISNGTFNFPITFPNGCFFVLPGNTNAQGTSVDNAYAYPLNTSEFFAATKESQVSNAISNFAIAWIALGY